ncbi:hypothetical protein [Streptomyces sp. NBC_00370]|uniref:hypothetical protein n=1 Tax=Streptomyces sp. NBC_00370 TaxID=2975728 RepID=UPI002E270315
MAGTEESADDDALYVLTAVLLTPAQFPSVLGDDYPQACGALGLEPYARGYGLVFGQDGDGARWTVAVDDVSLVAVAIASWDCGMEYDLSPPERTVVSALPGWPVALAVAAPGVPDPHDPEPDGEPGPQGVELPLTPPDAESWGPAQRRLGADEIALQWAIWREQFDSDGSEDAPAEEDTDADPSDDAADSDDSAADGDSAEAEDSGEDAATDTDGAPETTDTEEPPKPSHPGVQRVLKELHGYLASPPPLGRIRSSFAPGGARTLRADGPGWSFVARTDDIAFILLDEEPAEVLPVGRGTELPGLLRSLDEIAVRPA